MKEDLTCTTYLEELVELMQKLTPLPDDFSAKLVVAGTGYQAALAEFARRGKNATGYNELLSNYEEYRQIVLEFLGY